MRIAFDGPFYVGLGVCAHDKDVTETAVVLERGADHDRQLPATKPVLYSTLETQAITSTDRRVVYVTPTRIEAPNWLRDGKTLVYNSGGRLYRIPAAGGTPEVIDTGFAIRCNNDHGVSPDGTQLVISDQSQGDRQVAHLHAAGRRRHAEARHADRPVVLARLVAGRQDAGLLRRAQRRVRRLHHPRRRRPGDAADDGQGARRRPRVFAGRQAHLLQLRPHRPDADLADEGRRQRTRSR